MDKTGQPGYYAQSFARGLSVIKAFGDERRGLTLSEVARITDMPRAAARRFLLTMVDLAYARLDGKLFYLTPRVLDLGYAYLSQLTMTEVAEPHLDRLMKIAEESCSMAVLDDDKIVTVLRATADTGALLPIGVGTRFPAYATSMGRVLLAGIDDAALDQYLARLNIEPFTSHTVSSTEELRDRILSVRELGYCFLDQELGVGLQSLAGPIRDTSGQTVAAICVSSFHISRVSLTKTMEVFLPLLQETAHAIEQDMNQHHVRGRRG